jgi:hypothetical protein
MPLTKIQSLGITDGTIVNADINASAAIAGTKLTGVGKVLQVVTATDSTTRTTTSSSYVTGSNTLSVAITPSSASNKILLLFSSAGRTQTDDKETRYTIFRDATDLSGGNGLTMLQGNRTISISMSFLDSPNTTSAITYQVYMKGEGTHTITLNEGSVKGSLTALEIAA